MSLEKNLVELEAVVKKLDDKNLSVEDSIACFERGVALAKDTLVLLKDAKGKLEGLNCEIDKLADELKEI